MRFIIVSCFEIANTVTVSITSMTPNLSSLVGSKLAAVAVDEVIHIHNVSSIREQISNDRDEAINERSIPGFLLYRMIPKTAV